MHVENWSSRWLTKNAFQRLSRSRSRLTTHFHIFLGLPSDRVSKVRLTPELRSKVKMAGSILLAGPTFALSTSDSWLAGAICGMDGSLAA